MDHRQHSPITTISGDGDPQTVVPAQSTLSLHLAIASQNFNRQSYLFLVDLTEQNGSEQALQIAREQYQQMATRHRKNRLISALLTREVGTARVKHIVTIDAESQDRVFRAELEDVTHGTFLTEAWHRPSLLREDARHITNNYYYTTNPTNIHEEVRGQIVLLVRTVLHKKWVACVLASPLVAAVGSGVAVGICLRRADIGVAVGAGLFTLPTFLLALAVWLCT